MATERIVGNIRIIESDTHYMSYDLITNQLYEEKFYSNKYLLHKEDGPAHVIFSKKKRLSYIAFAINGKYHREDYPAIIFYDKNGKVECVEYYLNGIRYADADIINNWKQFCHLQIYN